MNQNMSVEDLLLPNIGSLPPPTISNIAIYMVD
jgi:hypothetical protein